LPEHQLVDQWPCVSDDAFDLATDLIGDFDLAANRRRLQRLTTARHDHIAARLNIACLERQGPCSVEPLQILEGQLADGLVPSSLARLIQFAVSSIVWAAEPRENSASLLSRS
jgi:hypothetical protein